MSNSETTSVGPLSPPPLGEEAAQIGTAFADRYEIREPLRRGGQATVYRAFDRFLKIEVALKVVHSERDQETALARLRDEVTISHEATSPHLVRVFDGGDAPDGLYLTMEFLGGGSLRDRLAQGPLQVDEALRVAEGVLHGLAVLHAKRIVHRDVKPSNILFSAEGAVKLADLGLVRREERETLTEKGGLVGTLGYLSPEQVLRVKVSPPSDLYSLGLVLFEMLVGKPPHEAASPLALQLAALGHAPDIRKFQPEAPKWLARVVARLLEVRLADRYQDAASVLRDLEKHHAPGRPRLRRQLFRAAVLALFSVLVVGTPRFSHLVAVGKTSIAAVADNGQRLWKHDRVDSNFVDRWALVRPGRFSPPLLATILMPPGNFMVDAVSTLSFLDPETGKIVKSVELPNAADHFPNDPPRFAPSTIMALDLDQDGSDEVIVSYSHVPEAPSYTVLYSPKEDRARVVFVGYGGHRFEGAADVDGDGLPELLFIGINNGWNWVNAFAAVKVNTWPTSEENWGGLASSPDLPEPEDASLLWYAIVPPGHFENPHCLRIDPQARHLILRYASGKTWTLDYNGFPPGGVGFPPPKLREAARQETYRHIREADRLRRLGALEASWKEADAARRSAAAGREVWLGQYARRIQAKLLVEGGKLAEAEALFTTLAGEGDDAPEVAYDAGVAFHLHGDLERAVAWYERGMGLGSMMGVGKGKQNYVTGEVLALVEAKRYGEALQAVNRFDATYHSFASDLPLFRSYIRWRSGEASRVEAVEVRPNSTDLYRYWALEFDLARGAKPEELLPRVEHFLKEKPETTAEVVSLQAELLDRLGRHEDAVRLATLAVELVGRKVKWDIEARGHAALLEERAKHLRG